MLRMGSTLHIVGLLLILQSLVKVLSGQSDTCLTCQRRPNSCRKIAGIFMVTVMSKGTYNPVVEIPTGACQINITELGPSHNYLAVKTKSSKSIVNSYWSLVPTGLYEGAGTIFQYAKNRGAYCPGQCLFTDGSLNQTIVIQLLYYSKNPGISYEFLLPNYIPFTPFEGTFVPQHPHTVHHKHRHRQRSHGQGQGHQQRSHFEGEYGPTYNGRSEGQQTYQHGRNTQEFRATGNSNQYEGRYLTRNRQQSRTKQQISASPRRYGYDTLGGRGLSYTQEQTNTDNSQGQFPIHVAKRPTYVSPYDANGRFSGHETLEFRSALIERTYVRGAKDAHAHTGVGNEISNTYTGRDTSTRVSSGVSDTSGNRYEWKISGFTECSHTCGGGFQETHIVCVSKNSQSQVTVTDDNCNNAIKPTYQRVECNTNPCAPDWEVEEWSDCSVTCGSGTQTRRVECKQRMSPTLEYSISASKCDIGRRPAIAQQCEKEPCAKWKTSKWGKCSVSCGVGERRRRVKCVDHQGTQIPDRFCDPPPPDAVKQCDQGTCEKQWWMSKWSDQCSNECGTGVKTRSVLCGSRDGGKLLNSQCDQSRRPQSQESCRSQAACGGKWFTGPWGKCSALCGSGVKRRDVVCMKAIGTALSITVEENCVGEEKPIMEEQCVTETCGSEWFMSQWSECSVTCGSGMKSRDVKCLNQELQRARSCDRSHKPATRESCNMRDCNLPQATKASPRCKDQFRSCLVVLQARLCSYNYYRKICCASCRSVHS